MVYAGIFGMRYMLTWLMHKNFYFSFFLISRRYVITLILSSATPYTSEHVTLTLCV